MIGPVVARQCHLRERLQRLELWDVLKSEVVAQQDIGFVVAASMVPLPSVSYTTTSLCNTVACMVPQAQEAIVLAHEQLHRIH